MNETRYNLMVSVIEEMIEKNINSNKKYTWRELKRKKFFLILESIDCLIYFIRKSLSMQWEEVKSEEFNFFEKKELFLKLERLNLEEYLNDIDVAIVYQLLSADDIARNSKGYHFVVDKHQRDNLGAYYTPLWLSYELTLKTIDEYFLNRYGFMISEGNKRENLVNIFLTMKVADLSIGAGSFLISYIKIIKKFVTRDRNLLLKIVKGIYGMDVDPVALLICKHELSKEFGKEIVPINLIFGNPLFNAQSKASDKLNNIAEGRIYNSNMGVDIKRLYSIKFDIIIGNPPWEKIRFEERKFFKQSYPEISHISKKSERQIAIMQLKEVSFDDYSYYEDFFNDYKKIKNHFIENDMLNYSLNGELNTYSLFYELAFNLLSEYGSVGLLVKSSMVKTPSNKKLFNYFVENGYVSEINLIKNSKKIFKIDSREEFSFIISSRKKHPNFIVYNAIMDKKDLLNKSNPLIMDYEMLSKLNPSSKMLPNVENSKELEFLISTHRDSSLFSEVFPSVVFGRLVHFTSHSEYISKNPKDGLPIYEGKFIERYDSMFATFRGVTEINKYKPKASAKVQDNERKEVPESRFYINQDFWNKLSKNYKDEYTIMWRSLTSVSNRRTMLATVMPFVPTSQSIQFLQVQSVKECIIILSIFNSIVFDYLVRLKMPGIDLTQSVIKSIPVPLIKSFDKVVLFNGITETYLNHIKVRILWLYRNDSRVQSLFEYRNYGDYDCESEKKCNSEIDVLIGQLYGMTLQKIKRIASQFPAYYSPEELLLFF